MSFKITQLLRCCYFISTAIILLLIVGGNNTLSAQDRKVTGLVKDNSGAALIGVAVTATGAQRGDVTDVDGRYTISIAGGDTELIFSYLGMKTQSVSVGSRTVIDIVMEEEKMELEEVVVIGYGEVRRSDLTGSIKSVDSESINNQALTSVDQGLMGRVAGVQVTPDYSPGGSVSIQIRGSNSMMGGTEPLYVVDGVPMDPMVDAAGNNSAGESQSSSSMNFINPDDIASMEVLKDASATAIYGARGANGVVLITTKSAEKGRTNITYSTRFNVSQVANTLDLMTSEEYASMINQREINRYYLETTHPTYGLYNDIAPISLKYNGVKEPLPWDLPNTNWQTALFDTALSQMHTIQAQGANEKTKYFLSLGYSDQNGIMKNTDFERFTLNSNVTQQFNEKLSVTNNLNIAHSGANGGMVNSNDVWSNRSLVTSALYMQPYYDLHADTDNYDESSLDTFAKVSNPYLLAERLIDKKINIAVTENVSAVYKLNKNLSFTARGAAHLTTSERNQYWPRNTQKGKQNNGVATISDNQNLKLLGELRFNYTKRIKKHTISFMGAYTFENIDFQSRYNEYKNFPDDDLTYFGIESATEHSPTQVEWRESSMAAYIARANYKYKDKYLVTATFRADGSSRFAEDRKWGYFPSLAAAWRVTEEKFMPRSNTLNSLKLRASYGQTGSQGGINPYNSLGITTGVNTSFDGQPAQGLIESNFANPDLTWETTTQYNAGVDATLFNQHLYVTVDYYHKTTNDLLQTVRLPESTGYVNKVMNLGSVLNQGVEVELGIPLIAKRDVNLTLNLNGSLNRNKLLSLGGNSYMTGPEIGEFSVNRFIVGQPLGVFWGWQCDGVVADWDEVARLGYRNLMPGEYRFRNVHVDYQLNPDGTPVIYNGEKVPLEVQTIDNDDKMIIGDPNPDFIYGSSIVFNYKNVDFSMLMQGQVGGDIFWYDYSMMTQMNRSFNTLSSAGTDAWVAPMEYSYMLGGEMITMGNAAGNIEGASMPSARATNSAPAGVNGQYRNTDMNSANIFDASYFKISNISVGYTFRNIKFMNNIRISAAVNNVFTFSKYPGYDPSTLSFAGNPMRRGIDFGSYPPSRTYIFSAQFSF